jgi:hypothetical protein
MIVETVTAASAATSAVASPGFLSAAAAFIGAMITSWPAIALLLVIGVLAEHNNSRGFAIFLTLVAAVVAYFLFSVSIGTLLLYATAYVLIGVCWSIWRYRSHVLNTIKEHKSGSITQKERVLRELHPKYMLGAITAWIVIWPISLIENFIGDIITGIQTLVTKVFRVFYHRIYDQAVQALTMK